MMAMYRRQAFHVHLSSCGCYCARMSRLAKSWLPIALCSVLGASACTSGDDGNANSCDPGNECDEQSDAQQSDDGGVLDSADAAQNAICDTLGDFPIAWISGGPDCGVEPDIQVHKLNDDTYILRQSLCTSGEAPFLYLLFGEDKALLEDTGDGGIDVVSAVQAIVSEREAAAGHDIELIVVNSHAHGDHVRGNQAFQNAGATVVGASQSALINFFGMSWPRQVATYDLGSRLVDIAGIPGHENNHIAMYDHQYGMLLTGDTLYPGRLFINNFSEYKASIDFLVNYSADKELCAILGTHIELSTTPGDDYEFGVDHHPNERALELDRATLLELQAAITAMGNTAVRETHDNFIIFPI
tara:strand:+ start:99483 stop:100553 length:1071 start_codon:yes stop_codon:yes gene_type:complete